MNESYLRDKGFVKQTDGSWSKPKASERTVVHPVQTIQQKQNGLSPLDTGKPRQERRKVNYDTTRTSIQNSKQRKCAAQLDSNNARETQGSKCPIVRFTLCRVRLLDVDAKYGSIKDLLDGLQYAGLIHGDKEGQITLEVLQQKVNQFREEKTIIEIRT